jgi:L-lactate dehydrogenase complex protein LldG
VVGEPVSEAREEILQRVRQGLADVPRDERPEDVDAPRAYLEHEPEAGLDRFVERVADYGAVVHVVEEDGVAAAVASICREFGVTRVVVPEGLEPAWIPAELEAIPDQGLLVGELDRVGAALTGCALGIAETGTVVLDSGRSQGRRALTLVPDVHVCVIDERQVVDGVPAALRRLSAELRGDRRPLTFVSGPSATSDIELSRVEGVHGPRRFGLVVVRRLASGLDPIG